MFFVGLGWWIRNCMFFHPFAEQPQWSCLVLVALGSVASGKQSSAGYIGYDLPERSSDCHQACIDICDSQKTQITWTCVVSGHQEHLMTGCSGGGQRGRGCFLHFFKIPSRRNSPFWLRPASIDCIGLLSGYSPNLAHSPVVLVKTEPLQSCATFRM